ncbi:MAG: AI-2E family transporter [Ruminococcus sp.]|nr:AI-2E family transporter [Ruminococcus sp.]
MPKKPNHNINKTLSMTLIFSGAVLILLAFVLMRIENILGWIGSLLSIMRPMFIGILLTFILYKPTILITEFLERSTKGRRFPCDGVAVAITYVLFLGILTGLVWIVVPSFISSIEEFSTKFSTYMNNIQDALNSVLSILQGEDGNGLLSQVDISAEDIITQITNVVSMIPDYVPDVMEKVGEWASGLTGVLTDIIFGIAFSVYILIGRKKLKRQVKRIIRTFFTEPTYRRISHYSSLTFQIFSNFVSGQLMEAVILGLLCFLGMTILGFPYAVMISVIVGVTNIIPIIGPIIGTVPGAIIYLMIDPWKAVWFVIFVVIMQQIDSNLIYPRVVGSSVGLPAIWILFAVTVGGGLFGVVGMLVGVPVMSLIYTILREKTAAAAALEPSSGEHDDRAPLFPAVGEKTTALFSKLAQSVRSGFGQVMDKVDERVHRKEQHAEEQTEPSEEDTAESRDIEAAMEQLEQEEAPAETE